MAKGIKETISDLQTAYEFYNRGLYSFQEYQSAVQSISQDNPTAFAQIQEANTKAKSKKLNELSFGKDTLPLDAKVADLATYALDVPFGFEGEPSIVGAAGITNLGRRNILLAGQAHPMTSLHEGLHLFSNRFDNTQAMDPFTAESVDDEVLTRSMDLLRAYAEEDEGRIKSTMKYMKSAYPDVSRQDMVEVALNAINQYYYSGALEKDPEALKEALSYFDKENQGFISGLLFEPEKLNQFKMQFIQGAPLEEDLAPFAVEGKSASNKDIGKFATLLQADDTMTYRPWNKNVTDVIIDLDRTGLESTIK